MIERILLLILFYKYFLLLLFIKFFFEKNRKLYIKLKSNLYKHT